MASSEARLLALSLLAASVLAGREASADPPAGFAVERLYTSAPGAGWLVMDDLQLHGGLGGAVEVTTGYARDPLRVTSGGKTTDVVSDQAFADVGLAVTYDRFRLYVNFDAPLAVSGDGASSPSVSFASNPDTLADPRVGFDARLFGRPKSPFRLGLGAQLILPSGNRSDYLSDGSYRAMGRVLVAGDLGLFTYAAHLGVHVRPLDDASIPDGPRGSELLFGAAAGARLGLGKAPWAFVVGPEVFGETAFQSFFGAATTGVEGLVSARIEGTGEEGAQLRVKLAAGGGLDAGFGAPEWRAVFAIEVSGHATPALMTSSPGVY